MSAPRFFVDAPLLAGAITLPSAVAHHVRVRRLVMGDAVQLFNAQGQSWIGEISCLSPNAEVRLSDEVHQVTELPFTLTLAQSLIEPSKMDWVLEKAVELGVAALQPIAAARSVTRLDTTRAAKRALHWQGIAIAASEQCRRDCLMAIQAPQTVAQALATRSVMGKNVSTSQHLLLHPEGGVSLKAWCKGQPAQAVTLWVGPEGGWSPAELTQLEAAGAQRITFGPRVLRTETAGLAVAAALQAIWA